MTKNKFIERKCRRNCGKTVTSLTRSVWGVNDTVREKYQFICHDCLTKKERNELLDAISTQMLTNLRK